MNGILIGLLLAVLYCIILLPAHAGQGTNLDLTIYPILYKGMIFIPISKTQSIHLHHWMIFLGVLLFWRHLHPVRGDSPYDPLLYNTPLLYKLI